VQTKWAAEGETVTEPRFSSPRTTTSTGREGRRLPWPACNQSIDQSIINRFLLGDDLLGRWRHHFPFSTILRSRRMWLCYPRQSCHTITQSSYGKNKPSCQIWYFHSVCHFVIWACRRWCLGIFSSPSQHSGITNSGTKGLLYQFVYFFCLEMWPIRPLLHCQSPILRRTSPTRKCRQAAQSHDNWSQLVTIPLARFSQLFGHCQQCARSLDHFDAFLLWPASWVSGWWNLHYNY